MVKLIVAGGYFLEPSVFRYAAITPFTTAHSETLIVPFNYKREDEI